MPVHERHRIDYYVVVYMRPICMGAYHNFKIISETSLYKFASNLMRLFRCCLARLKRLDKMKSLHLILLPKKLFCLKHLRICFIARTVETGSQRILDPIHAVKSRA